MSIKSQWNAQNSYRMMLLSLKGSKHCEQQKKRFNLCRATPIGKYGDPSVCQNDAIHFLNCFLSEKVSGHIEQLKKATDCLVMTSKQSNILSNKTLHSNFQRCSHRIDQYMNA